MVPASSIGVGQQIQQAAEKPKGLGELVADKFIEVDAKHRPLRVCFMAAIAVEIMTDRVRLFDPSKVDTAIGRLLIFHSLADRARKADPNWMNADMADVAMSFASLLREAGQEKMARILFEGPTISNFIDIAARVSVTNFKGAAMYRDMDAMFDKLASGDMGTNQAWAACETRFNRNREVLKGLSQVQVPSQGTS